MFKNFFSFGRFFNAEYYAPSRTCFQRKTNRYGRIGTWSNHQQYLLVNRDIDTGRFIPKIRQAQ
jgi:hypothetical protein